MTYSELERKIKAAGCVFDSHGGKHDLYRNPKTGEKFPISHSKTKQVATGTLDKILKAAGLK